MTPLITCSILCYNYGRYLSQAIDSCLNQTIDPSLFEVLVIDDGSTDETPAVCAVYGDLIRVSRTANQGFAKSLERGLAEAKGAYVAYLDADDWWELNKLERILPELVNNKRVVIHPMREVDSLGMSIEGRIGSCGNTSSLCVEREAGLSLMPATSEIFCRPLLDSGLGTVLTEPLASYRIHTAAMTDRSPSGSHTQFFARTSHVTADRLFELVQNPPEWASSSAQVAHLAEFYRSEGCIKDFERATEVMQYRACVRSLWVMLFSLPKARRFPRKREWRLMGRFLGLLVKGRLSL